MPGATPVPRLPSPVRPSQFGTFIVTPLAASDRATARARTSTADASRIADSS